MLQVNQLIGFGAADGSACPVATSADATDDYYYNVALLLDATGKADGTAGITDESRYAGTVTVNGNATISSEKFSFDGTGDYLSLADAVRWTPGSRFTVEVFSVYIPASGTQQQIVGQLGGSNQSWDLLYNWTSGGFTFDIWPAGTTSGNTVVSSLAAPDQTYDVAVTWDGTTLRFYLDGRFVDSTSYSGAWFDSSAALQVGAGAPGFEQYFAGTLKAVRITRGVARYTHESGCGYRPLLPLPSAQSALTDSHWASVVALITGGDTNGGTTFRDESPYDWKVSAVSSPETSTGTQLAGANSILFDGSTDVLYIGDDATLELGSGDFTVDWVVKFNTVTTTQSLGGKYNSATNSRSWLQYLIGGSSQSRQDFSSNGTSNTITTQTWSPATATEYHLRLCRASGTVRVFVDGVLIGSNYAYASTLFNGSANLSLGAIQSTGSAWVGFFNGYMAEFRLTKAARNTSDTSFTPPASPWPRG